AKSKNQEARTKNQKTNIKRTIFSKKVFEAMALPSSYKEKTLHYVAENVSDFAWFADKNFIVKTDTIQLSTHTVKALCYILPESEKLYSNCMRNIKRAVRFYNDDVGEYPFPTVNIVCSPKKGPAGGMEYPMITIVNEQ